LIRLLKKLEESETTKSCLWMLTDIYKSNSRQTLEISRNYTAILNRMM